MRKNIREKSGVPPLSLLMHEYSVGDKVAVIINPAIHKGMPHRRYYGRTGVITGKQGKSYMVKIMMGSKEKNLYIRPEHLKPL